jgi:hypothetical protein
MCKYANLKMTTAASDRLADNHFHICQLSNFQIVL